MALAVRSSSKNQSTTGTAVTVTAPAGVTAGDIVVCIVFSNGLNTTIVNNNGANPFTEDVNDYSPTTDGATMSVFSRRMTGSEAGSYAFTLGSSQRWSIIAVAFSGPNASSIYDAGPTTNFSDTGNTNSTADITTVTDGSIHCAVCGLDLSTATFTATPAGYTEQERTTNEPISFCWKVITPAGATGAQAFTQGAGGADFTMASFAIKAPSAAAAPTVTDTPSTRPDGGVASDSGVFSF